VPTELESFLAMLATIEAVLQPWHAHACLDARPVQAPQDLAVRREMRRLAALVAMYGMAIVVRGAWVVDASHLFYVHASSFRPCKVSADWAVDAVVPSIGRIYIQSPPLQIGLDVLWLIGATCGFLLLVDRFEPGSVQEGLACSAVALTLPSAVCITASLNARTVRLLLKQFETLYVLAFVLGMVCFQLVLFREHPAKLGGILLTIPTWLTLGFVDAYLEDGRLLKSRVFFCFGLTCMLAYLALIVFRLADFADNSFRVLAFTFVPSSIFCCAMTTLLMFGAKNIVMSFACPGSLVNLIGDVCCIVLDADALSLLEATHTLLALAYGRHEANTTMARQVRKRQESISAASVALACTAASDGVNMPTMDPLARMECEIDVTSFTKHAVEAGDGMAQCNTTKVDGRKRSGDCDVDGELTREPSPFPTPPPAEVTPPAPSTASDVESLCAVLLEIEADLRTRHVHSCLDSDPSNAAGPRAQDLTVHREIRSRATQMTLFAIAIVVHTTWAVDPSQLLYVHAASFRPCKVRMSKGSVAESSVPAISRAFFRSRPLQVALPMLWVIGIVCGFLVLLDRFEHGSVQEGIACFTVTLTFPSIVCIGASFNARTVRRLLHEFETLYVLMFVLGMVSMQLLLFREHPAKLGCIVLTLPSLLLSGFMDAYVEGGRVLTSRVFFCLNLAGLLIYVALFVLKLGGFADYTFRVLAFAIGASSVMCNAISTLVAFGAKNIAMSFARPGSLVTLVSDICCILLDADALALLKAAYSLLWVAYGRHKANRTVARQVRKRQESIAAAHSGRMVLASSRVAPVPTDEVSTPPAAPWSYSLDEELSSGAADEPVNSACDSRYAECERGQGHPACPPFDLDA
jgi:hypothetical protein